MFGIVFRIEFLFRPVAVDGNRIVHGVQIGAPVAAGRRSDWP